ncbi:MAG: glycerophosphodiester phosphodiesterase family protein [Crocinitomicaceae bacterium]|nr:glycerophosphodiester phosphodiesterase family protein [Crocinitomicaceae bacterium]
MRLISGVIFFLFLLISCSKKQDYSKVQLFGHAGMGLSIENSFYHDNSLESIELALSINGCDGVEVDVQMSLDKSLWLYHDPNLETQTDFTGCISSKTDKELENVRYKTFSKEKLIKLNELDFNILKNKTIILDLKNFNYCTSKELDKNDFINALKQLPFVMDSSIKVKIILKEALWLESFIDNEFDILYEANSLEKWNTIIDVYPSIKGLIIKTSKISKSEVQNIHLSNKEVFLFEMRSPNTIREALIKNPDGIISDDLRGAVLEKY